MIDGRIKRPRKSGSEYILIGSQESYVFVGQSAAVSGIQQEFKPWDWSQMRRTRPFYYGEIERTSSDYSRGDNGKKGPVELS